ncbi:ribonuclease HI [Marivirga harenae]|uniref:ribonuclease HI n=1 Tax=Marivirga harenae TaxID=2010992 RepID=UPI0026E0B2DA|nr:RNase H family protein [Marivirga harenae]WKV11431.1 ribonuclease H [Marivirga harenae]
MKNKQLLFIDGSVNNQLKVGYGAALLLNENELFQSNLKEKIVIRKFVYTSSTKLELQTLIWAIEELVGSVQKVVIYTDSQNIMGLPGRRKTLEENDFHSKKGKLLNHHELYRAFFEITDKMHCEFVKVKGHQASENKKDYERVFTLVDRAARKASRELE